jgi:hypothetical protein
MNKVVDLTGGFALVLAAAKAYLEHGIDFNIVADRFWPNADMAVTDPRALGPRHDRVAFRLSTRIWFWGMS